ncbi:MAG: hypothetical protein HYZ13_15450 [Acidobacteria bacterium]|nr:hypothetical protein [Acidobacteriota bacterium]
MKITPTLLLLMTPALFAQGAPKGDKPASAGQAAPEPSATDAGVIKLVPYKPTLSREPFLTLSDAGAAAGGDLVDDLAVKGRFVRDGKVFAIIADSRGNTRWLPIGYKFKDGELVAIDDKSVTFHQWDPNSTNKSVYRKVVKSFKREEAKR